MTSQLFIKWIHACLIHYNGIMIKWIHKRPRFGSDQAVRIHIIRKLGAGIPPDFTNGSSRHKVCHIR